MLSRREPTRLAEIRKESDSQPTEDVVDHTLGNPDFRVGRVPHRLKSRMGELVDKYFQGDAVLKTHRDRRAKRIHQAADGAAFLGHGDKQFARSAIGIQANVDVAFMPAHIEFVGQRLSRIGQTLAARPRLSLLSLFLFRPFVVGLGVEGLALLRAVAIDSQCLQAQFPAPHVGFVRRRFRRHVDGLGNRSGEEGLSSRHHLDVGSPSNTSNAVSRLERAIKHRKVLVR